MAARADEALRATAAVCEALGLRPSGLDVIRSSSYVAIRIAGTPYLARVGRAAQTRATHAREMALATALAAAGGPVASPAPVPDPLVVDGESAVGLWLWVDECPGATPTMAELGTVLRQVHEASERLDLHAIGLGLPDFAAPDRARARLTKLVERGHVDTQTASELTDLIDALAPAGEADGFVHGDFRSANVLMADTGPVVIDFDAASFGPPAWDLTLIAQKHRHFGLPRTQLDQFLHAYGGIGHDHALFEELCRLRDVVSAVWALSIAARVEPAFAAEARRRVKSACDPADRSRWSWDGLPSARG